MQGGAKVANCEKVTEVELKERMRDMKKEILAIAGGIVVGVLFMLLFSGIIGYLEDRNLYEPRYVPYSFGMIFVAVLVAWALMGILRVKWIEKWILITKGVLSFMIPFTLISVATVYMLPAMWDNSMYWLVNAIVSCCFAIRLFKDLIPAEE